MKLFLLWLSLALITACHFKQGPSTTPPINRPTEVENEKNVEMEEKYTFLALGDSYTIGEAVKPADSWPVVLAKELSERDYPTATPVIVAKTGWRTDELIAAANALETDGPFDMVSILIGVNNQYQGKSLEQYEKDLHELVKIATAYSKRGKAGIFAVSIPDYGVTPFAGDKGAQISKELKEWNSKFEEVMGGYNIPFYNITPISQKAKNDQSLTAGDKLHPSAKMYRQWVDHIAGDVIREVLPPRAD
jgi:lysophospholipase L1-like esterase